MNFTIELVSWKAIEEDCPTFRGQFYDIPKDHKRLSKQFHQVKGVLMDYKPHTLEEVHEGLAGWLLAYRRRSGT